MNLFVFTFTNIRCGCGGNKDGKTQEKHLELLVTNKSNLLESLKGESLPLINEPPALC